MVRVVVVVVVRQVVEVRVVVRMMVRMMVVVVVVVCLVHGMRIDRAVAVGVLVTMPNTLSRHMNRVYSCGFLASLRRRVVIDGCDRHHCSKGNEGTEENRGLAGMHHCELRFVKIRCAGM